MRFMKYYLGKICGIPAIWRDSHRSGLYLAFIFALLLLSCVPLMYAMHKKSG